MILHSSQTIKDALMRMEIQKIPPGSIPSFIPLPGEPSHEIFPIHAFQTSGPGQQCETVREVKYERIRP